MSEADTTVNTQLNMPNLKKLPKAKLLKLTNQVASLQPHLPLIGMIILIRNIQFYNDFWFLYTNKEGPRKP